MAKKPLKKSLLKITKLSFLLTVREGYILIRNFLGLVYHPFATLKTIKKEHDHSQLVLIPSFIFLPMLISFIFGFSSWILIKLFNPFFSVYLKFLVVFTNSFSFLFFVSTFLYLLYWSFQVLKKDIS